MDHLSLNQPRSNWTLNFHSPGSHSEKYPHTARGSSRLSSLIVVFKVLKADLDDLCSGGIQGFSVSLHLPNERPQTYRRYFYIPLKQTVALLVKPRFVEPSPSVRKHAARMRGCYLKSERQLRFYKHYTSANCRMECLTNFTLARCGCVKYSMPRASFESRLTAHWRVH